MADIVNGPDLWLDAFPRPSEDGHKYDRGHAVVVGAPDLTGATRLAATACSRIGAGLVTVVTQERAGVYRTSLPADIMVSDDTAVAHRRATAYLLGPGGLPSRWHQIIEQTRTNAVAVLDAAAIAEFPHLQPHFAGGILTPHEGEFAAVFPDIAGDREERAKKAAAESGAILVLKGSVTLIASPDGRIVTNTNASPYLAKAGSGDVLAGFITGLAAQEMSPFDAACAAVWMHGELGRRIGPGLVPGDLIDRLRDLLWELLQVD